MDTLDFAGLCQMLLRLGLVTYPQIEEAREEAAGDQDLDNFVRLLERKQYLTVWQTSKLVKGDTSGYFLGGYRLLYKLSSGTFGRVYRADEPATGRIVAVKVLRRRWNEDQTKIDAFFREAHLGMTLKHPNIVEILAVGQDKSAEATFIVMEFVEGGNLRDILQIRKKFTVSDSLRITEEAALGLAGAYSRGVTHRDLKLTNILLSSQGTAKLVDFGLAQIYTSMGGEAWDKVERTVDYAGLEKATDVKTGDVRSDIYFLGCVLYELLTGRAPLARTRNPKARMARERFEKVQSISPEEVTAPASVFMLVETMMSLDAQHRYQTPSQLLEAIRRARRDVDGKPATAHGSSESGKQGGSLFVVESDERLQDVFREKFKQLGYRVLIASDPTRAADRFRQQPFDALIMNVDTVGEEGIPVFQQVMDEARMKRVSCAGLVILGQEQTELQESIPAAPTTAVLVRPVTIKQLVRKLTEVMAASKERPAARTRNLLDDD